MESLSAIIENPEAFQSRVGDWPDLHDSEILEMCLKRTPSPPQLIMLLQVPVYERQGERPHLSYYWLIGLAFAGINDVELSGFNEQNVIEGIFITRAQDSIHVTIESIYGVGGEFTCSSARVLDVQRLAHNGSL